MRCLVDTSAFSAFLHGHESVVEEMRSADALVLTPIVLGELMAGFRKGTRFGSNMQRLQDFLISPRARWVPLDDETADRYSRIHDSLRRVGTPAPTNDLWIAASAMQHGLKLLTTDPRFQRISQVAVSLHAVE